MGYLNGSDRIFDIELTINMTRETAFIVDLLASSGSWQPAKSKFSFKEIESLPARVERNEKEIVETLIEILSDEKIFQENNDLCDEDLCDEVLSEIQKHGLLDFVFKIQKKRSRQTETNLMLLGLLDNLNFQNLK